MPVDLSPVGELDIDAAILDFAAEKYCANCRHFATRETDDVLGVGESAYCERWEMPTRVESGMICPEYVPQGFE